MLYLVFRIAEDRYALAAEHVAEVLPALPLKQLPGAVRGVAGVCHYRGEPVPVIDLCLLTTGRPVPRHWGTRLMLVHHVPGSGQPARLLGLLAEDVTQLLRREDGDFIDAGVRSDGAPYLGPVSATPQGLVQRVQPEHLLSAAVRERLFAAADALP